MSSAPSPGRVTPTPVAGTFGASHLVALACSIALFLPLAWPLLNGRIFVFDDLANFHFPVRYLYKNALVAGDSVLWTPALFAGFYLHGEGQVGMFHPLHLLLYRTLPLDVAFNLEFLSSYVLGFAGMYWFARRLSLSRDTSITAAMLFAFGGFQLLHFHHMNVVAVTAHIPWLLACIDMVLTEDGPARKAAGYGGVAIVIASEVLVGFPQAVWWSLLAAAAFALWRTVEQPRYRRLVACGFAIATGVLLGAIQLLPTFDVVAHSTRVGIPRDFALTYSLHPYNIIQLWSPYALHNRVYSQADYPQVHEFGIYSGTLALIAPLWLWARRDALGGRRSLVIATSGFAALTFVLALGRYGYVDVLLTYLPGLGSLRAPARYIVLVQFALVVLSAIALEDLASVSAERRRVSGRALAIVCVPALLSVLTTALLNTHVLPFVPRGLVTAPWRDALGGTIMVVTVTVVFLAATRLRRAIPLLIICVAIDLACWGTIFIFNTRPRHPAELTSLVPPPAEGGGRYQAWADEWRDKPILKGHWLAMGYAGLFPQTTLKMDSPEFLRLAGVRTIVEPDGAVRRMPNPVPRARFLADPSVAVRVVVDRPGRIVVATDTLTTERLAITERMHEGWSARLPDGTALPLIALSGDFISCDVPPGVHRIEFEFHPRSFRNGEIASACGVLALIAGIYWASRR